MGEHSDPLEDQIQPFVEAEPLLPHSFFQSPSVPGRSPETFDVATHDNPQLLTFAQAIVADPRYVGGGAEALLAEIQKKMNAALGGECSSLVQHMRFDVELMRRLRHAIAFVTRQTAKSA